MRSLTDTQLAPNVDLSHALAQVRAERLRRQAGVKLPAPTAPTQWPPDYSAVLAWRQVQLARFEVEPQLIESAKVYYKDHPVEFIMHWCDTYDPRNVALNRLTRMPFILFKRQQQLVEFVVACIRDEEAGMVEKCRDMGATWVAVCISVWLWLFYPGASIGWGSRKQELVDRLGDPDSIFEKIRMCILGMPKVFLPANFVEKEHLNFMRCVNPKNGATIVGEVGDNIGRGGRKLTYFKDEAQPLYAKLLTPTGWITMADVEVGHQVIGADGRPTKVTQIKDCGVHEVYRVTFSDGTFADCSHNHLWTVERLYGHRKLITLPTHELMNDLVKEYKSGVFRKYRVKACAAVQFAKTSDVLPLEPYIVGLLLGDGGVSAVPKGGVSFTTADQGILDELIRLLPVTCMVTTSGGYGYRVVDTRLKTGQGVKSIARTLVFESGIAGCHSWNKFIPDKYKFSSVSNRLKILQGLMDTDGSASTGGTAMFASCSRQLSEDVRFLAQSLGGRATINARPDARGFRTMYPVFLALPERMCPFRLARKVNQWKKRSNTLDRTVMAISHLGAMPVRCISVSNKDGLYLTDHCIVTHNSGHYEHAEKIEAALSDNTRVPIDISSVNGPGNVFHRRREAGVEWSPGVVPPPPNHTRVFIMDWRDHPAKSQTWYDARKAKAERDGLQHIFAQEVDRNYFAAVEGVIIPAPWVQAAIDAHIKLRIDLNDGPYFGGLDVADSGGDRNALAIRRGVILRSVGEWGERDVGVTARRAIAGVCDFIPIELQYDVNGVGAGVKAETNRLKDDAIMPPGVSMVAWNAGGKVLYPAERVVDNDDTAPRNKDFFANLKAQAWWMLRDRFYKTFKAITEGEQYDPDQLISIPSELPMLRQLQKELSQPTATKGGTKMKLVVDKTPDGTRSPNIADAVVMAYWPLPVRIMVESGLPIVG